MKIIGKEKLFLSIFVLAIIFLSFLLGVVVSEYKVGPYKYFKTAFMAADAVYEKYRFHFKHRFGKERYEIYENLWFQADHDAEGVTVHKLDAALDGVTFYSGASSEAYLIDMKGKVLHTWSYPFYEAYPDAEHILDKVPEEQIYWRRAQLFPNGDVIAIYEGINQSPYGGGIIKVDKNSNLQWKLSLNAHHDLAVGPDGNIYTLMHVYRNTSPPYIDDGIAIIAPSGELIKEVALTSILKNSVYKDLIGPLSGDVLHTNNIEFLMPEQARMFPMFQAGDILISNWSAANTVFVLDGETYQPKWAASHMTRGIHDADFEMTGYIRIFDNGVANQRSRILDIDPATQAVVWAYDGGKSHPFYTENRGSQQTLPNGNILVTESTNGRLFEVTPEGEVVWEYVSTSYDGTSIGIVNWAQRFRRDVLKFLND